MNNIYDDTVKKTLASTKEALERAKVLIDGFDPNNITPETLLSLSKLMCAVVEFVTDVNTESNTFGGNDWGKLSEEPCRYCHKTGGMEFLSSNHPLDQHEQLVRCTLCKRYWYAGSTSA